MAARKTKNKKKFAVQIYVEAVVELEIEADTFEEARVAANEVCLIDEEYIVLDECELQDHMTQVRSIIDPDVNWPGCS